LLEKNHQIIFITETLGKNIMDNVCDVIASVLKEEGSSHVFGIPGDGTSDLLEALDNKGIEFALTKHESSAAIMASVWGEIMGTPGVCIATKTPGLTNLINGLGHAYLDRLPVLAITDSYPRHVFETVVRQRLDHQEIVRGITKWTGTTTADCTQKILTKAMRIATTPRQGPVHLDLPSDVSLQSSSFRKLDKAKNIFQLAGSPGMNVPEAVKAARKILLNAKAPIIIAGLEVRRSKAGKELQAFSRKFKIPVFTTALAKSMMPENDPLYAGIFLGGNLELRLLKKADLIIAIGLDTVDIYARPWKLTQPIISIDAVPNVNEFYHATIELVGDIGFFLEILMESESIKGKWDTEHVRKYRQGVIESLSVPTKGVSFHDISNTTRSLLPDDGIVTCDSGFHRIVLLHLWDSIQEHTFFTSHGFATMGYSLAAAIAAKLCCPDRHVVCMTGDAGFAMHMAEIETAVRLELPITIVVFSDETLSQISVKQERKGYKPVGVRFKNPDFEKLAESFGAAGYTVSSPDEYKKALSQALESEKPVIIGVNMVNIESSYYRRIFDVIRG